jgi:hypothetical protein
MTDFYLSFPTCKKLQEWGCDIAPNHLTFYTDEGEVDGLVRTECMDSVILRYHLLEDICCTHAREFFGEITKRSVSDNRMGNSDHREIRTITERRGYKYHMQENSSNILQQGKKDEAEKYFLEHTIFNPKNHD